MDAARTIHKLGAENVYVIYRRTEEQMPAEKKEIADAKQEGIQFLFQTNILSIIPDKNHLVKQIECIKTDNQSGTFPVNLPDTNFLLDMDYVVMAVGSILDTKSLLGMDIKLTPKNYIDINEHFETSQKGIFAIGDAVGAPSTVAWASKTGREAVNCIIEYLDFSSFEKKA